MKNIKLKKIAISMMGLVIAGAAVFTPVSAMAEAGDPSSVSGSIEGIPCSGSTIIDYRSATTTAIFYGTGKLAASVTLVSKDKSGNYHKNYATNSNSAVKGVSATAARGATSWETEYADGVVTIIYHGYTWKRTMRAGR